jgi:hypothetical protein
MAGLDVDKDIAVQITGTRRRTRGDLVIVDLCSGREFSEIDVMIVQ